jgi:hypothetical protein
VNTGKRIILLLISGLGLAQVMAGETIYFLVGDWPGRVVRNESFVLSLSKPEDIDYARYLISRIHAGFHLEGDRTIVVANVGAARDGINRNYLDPKFPQWSWQVAEFIAFAENVAEGIIFSPTALEEMDWSSPSGSLTVGFEGVYVIRELGPIPLYLSIIPEGQNLQFCWSAPGTNYFYSLEARDSLAGTNWFEIPGAAWPLKTNHWTLPQANALMRFYRIKAEQTSQ